MQHLLDNEIYSEVTADVDMDLEEDTHLPASGASVEAAHASAGQWVYVPLTSSNNLTCEACDNKTFSTKHRYQRHLMAHAIKGKEFIFLLLSAFFYKSKQKHCSDGFNLYP